MKRTTTLLIVLFLTGAPASSLACELWCRTPASSNHHHALGCHDGSRHLHYGLELSPLVTCHSAGATAPFLTEARPPKTDSIGVIPSGFDASVIRVSTDPHAVGWWDSITGPPSIENGHTILRI